MVLDSKSKIMEYQAFLTAVVMAIEEDIVKAANGGGLAGKRVRKQLMKIAKIIPDFRKEVTAAHKDRPKKSYPGRKFSTSTPQ